MAAKKQAVKSRASSSRSSKKRSSGKALARSSAKLPTNWREELLKDAQEESERTPAGGGNTISLRKNGQFRYQGADIGDSFRGVIVDHVFVKKWFDSEFDEDNPSPPACFALKLDPKNIAPSDASPNKQSEVCADCWANQWASGRKRGKACQDKHRIGIIHEDDLENADSADIIFMEIPVTSGENFNAFITKLTKAANTPSYAALIEFSMDPDADWQKLDFGFVERLPDEVAYLVKQRRKEARDALLTDYDVSGYDPKRAVLGKGGKKRGRRGDDDDAPPRRSSSRGGAAKKKRSRLS